VSVAFHFRALPLTIGGFAIKDQANAAGAPMVALAALAWSLIANPHSRGAPLPAGGPAAGIHPKGRIFFSSSPFFSFSLLFLSPSSLSPPLSSVRSVRL
jgi:hypothetical protein